MGQVQFEGGALGDLKREVVYSPQAALHRPWEFLVLFSRSISESWYLIALLFLRSIRSQYRQSLLGYAWIVIPTIATALIWILLDEGKLLQFPRRSTNVPYAVFVLIGVCVWDAYIGSLLTVLGQAERSKALLTKAKFAHEAIFIAGLAESVFQVALRLVSVLILILLLGGTITYSSLLVLPMIGVIVAFGFACGVLLVPLSLLFHDVKRTIPVLSSFLFLLTPVVYSVPEVGKISSFMVLNPLAPLLVTTRELFFCEPVSMPMSTAFYVLLSLLLCFISLVFFRVAIPHVVARLSA